jgi:glycosyltransferase involved in cell wall biosynthesis
MIDNIATTRLEHNSSDIAPLVSVLVPSYNHQKYVIECLESIKNSNYQRLELILSDDCSSDATHELAERWVQQNVGRFERATAVRQPRNLGIVKNLQFLFDNSQGKYLAFLASDDMLTGSGIKDRLNVLETNDNLDAIFGNCQVISESGEVIREQFLAPHITEALASQEMLFFALIRSWGPGGPVMMLRRTSVLEGGSLGRLPEDLQFEDRYIYIRLASRGKLGFLNRTVAKYRIVENSMSRSSSFAKIQRQGVLDSDSRNLNLLSGINKLYLRMEIEKSNAEINKHAGIAHAINKRFWEINSGLLWRGLYQWSRLSARMRFFSDEQTMRVRTYDK